MTGVDEFFEELRREYLAEAPGRLAELRKDLAALQAGEPDAAVSLKTRFHRLAGSGGSYGFPDISSTSREAERWLVEHPAPDAQGIARLQGAVDQVARAFDAAAVELGLPSAPGRRPTFAWRALVVGDSGGAGRSRPLIERVERALTDAEYTVTRSAPDADPARIPASERADLAVLVPGPDAERSAMVGRWTAAGPGRPGSVVLVSEGDFDPLVAPFAHLDHAVAEGRVETELLGLVRTLGRAATAPPSIAILDPEPAQVSGLLSALQIAGARVQMVSRGSRVRALLQRESPDLITTEWRLPDTTGPALLRFVRQTTAGRVMPVVVFSAGVSEEDRVAAIRAGADDVVMKSAPLDHVVRTLVARVDRSRQVRALAHRDDLTGLRNYASLVEELEAAASFAHRADETFALIILDLDHFRRVNESYGHPVGDQVLVSLARTVGATVRASDVLVRMGGEEFGVLARRCAAEHAVALAEKLRRAVALVRVAAGEQIVQVKASAGVACYPGQGTTAMDLLRAAERALREAKRSGRDRVRG